MIKVRLGFRGCAIGFVRFFEARVKPTGRFAAAELRMRRPQDMLVVEII